MQCPDHITAPGCRALRRRHFAVRVLQVSNSARHRCQIITVRSRSLEFDTHSQASDQGVAGEEVIESYTMLANASKGIRAGRSFSACTCQSASAGEISWVWPPMMIRVMT